MLTSSLFGALAFVVDILLTLLFYAVLIRALLSWVNPDPYNPVVKFIVKVTEPIMAPARRLIPPISGIDISAILVLVVLEFGRRILVGWIASLGSSGASAAGLM